MNQAKDFAFMIAKVAAAIVVIHLVQKNVMNVPMVGEYLPGFTAR
jgi:deoxyinosine 3'endonuclease (endonuclease V)